jgi:hypothetical protein
MQVGIPADFSLRRGCMATCSARLGRLDNKSLLICYFSRRLGALALPGERGAITLGICWVFNLPG